MLTRPKKAKTEVCARLLIRFEVGRDILKLDNTFYFIYFLLKGFWNDHCFSVYLRHFLVGKNVQIAGDIAGTY